MRVWPGQPYPLAMGRSDSPDGPPSGAATRSAGVHDGHEPRVRQEPRRVVIERMQPQIDAGRFPIKRTVGEAVFTSADVFADGHGQLAGVLKYRHVDAGWHEVPLTPLGDDSWGASFIVTELGEYEYTIEAWIDRFDEKKVLSAGRSTCGRAGSGLPASATWRSCARTSWATSCSPCR